MDTYSHITPAMISIHAPVKGATPLKTTTLPPPIGFQSTHP